MADYFSWARLIEAGGVTLIILALCSVVSFIVIIERLIYFRSRTADMGGIMARIRTSIGEGDISTARTLLQKEKSPVGYVLSECLEPLGAEPQPAGFNDILFEEIKSRSIAEKIPEMERYLNIEATLGTVAPFIGLLGTVLGIIRSFQSIGGNHGSAAGMAGLNTGIAEALVATAAGLFVAIPATIAYNYFRRRVRAWILEMEIAASRLKVLLLGARATR